MSFHLFVSNRAESELRTAADWWAQHRSLEQAQRWYGGFSEAIWALVNDPRRFPLARENDRVSFEIRQLNFGIGRRPTHRAVFTLLPDTVAVLTVRHLAQADIRGDFDLF